MTIAANPLPLSAVCATGRPTNVVWVEGPHTFGKDYFINRLLASLPIETNIHLVQVGSYVHKHVVGLKSPRRTFGFRNITREGALAWANAHIEVLKAVAEVTRKDPSVLCICNRSFLSSFVHNLNTPDLSPDSMQLWTYAIQQRLLHCNEAVSVFLEAWDKITEEYGLGHALVVLTELPGYTHKPDAERTATQMMAAAMQERLRKRGQDSLAKFDMQFAQYEIESYLNPPTFFTRRMNCFFRPSVGEEGVADFIRAMKHA